MNLSQEDCVELRNKMSSTDALALTLRKYRSLNEVIALLYAELTGDKRSSHINRLYSRYRTLAPDRDKAAMALWRERHGYR